MVRGLWACLALVGTVSGSGCGGVLPASRHPEQDSPGDPTPLSKCKVTASATSPLVTEWPVSEKSHLETRLSVGAVAVEYTGCSMRILDGCQVGGAYVFQRTTLGKDRIEILDEDELYAKLPLGAAALSAELKNSGRVAVLTTVAGQIRLADSVDSLQIPAKGSCGEATHVITGVAVGAFRMISGGARTTAGGATLVGAGVGAKDVHSEVTIREAGDPSSCEQTPATQVHPQCSSPIQLFLAAIPGRQPRVIPRSQPDQPRPPVPRNEREIGPNELVYLRIFNVDDVARVYINDEQVLSAQYQQDTGERDVTRYFKTGPNTVRFSLENTMQGYTWGFELRSDSRILFRSKEGTAGSVGANNNDQTTGRMFEKTIRIDKLE